MASAIASAIYTCLVIDVVKNKYFYFHADQKEATAILDSVVKIQRFWRHSIMTKKFNLIELN